MATMIVQVVKMNYTVVKLYYVIYHEHVVDVSSFTILTVRPAMLSNMQLNALCKTSVV